MDEIGTSKLQAFCGRMRAAGRILYGDVRRLQRDVLPDGIQTREEVRLLLDLERAVPRADRAFADHLVASISAFVVWGERPTGRIEEETASWLIAVLATERVTRTGLAIATEIVEEAEEVPAALIAFLDGRGRKRTSTIARSEPSASLPADAEHGDAEATLSAVSMGPESAGATL